MSKNIFDYFPIKLLDRLTLSFCDTLYVSLLIHQFDLITSAWHTFHQKQHTHDNFHYSHKNGSNNKINTEKNNKFNKIYTVFWNFNAIISFEKRIKCFWKLFIKAIFFAFKMIIISYWIQLQKPPVKAKKFIWEIFIES